MADAARKWRAPGVRQRLANGAAEPVCRHPRCARAPALGGWLAKPGPTLEATLAAYTRDAAYVEFQEGVKGQLRAGMLADLALLSGDIQATPVEQLKDMTVALTVCDGQVVYEA